MKKLLNYKLKQKNAVPQCAVYPFSPGATLALLRKKGITYPHITDITEILYASVIWNNIHILASTTIQQKCY